ncbi:sensor domain-containing diguanylate cyclase [Bifidobacterium adolescentis]|uniref:GGDEF domain-containing protein n=1 Tax=Bifidobacterium adolescentis TaxID=1680 RepID=UPI0004E5E1CE|nr:GGDEF domain-containing protein [Bifidobacterium adolescentis]AII75833.1 putative diguanylate cyclase (GGDEF) domain protein [Bifidobacterium adolescentis]
MADTPEMGRTPSTDELVPELTFDEIDRAFDNNEFCFYLQPKCNTATGAIVGAEALVRWNHPKYGVVSPGRFVPMLEQAGQISRLDVFVWRSVVRMLARWEREGRNLVPISVNVSMVDIDQMDVADTLTGLLNEYDVDARLLQAEITESAVARNLSKVESTIRKLHADNIAVLMDDFGSAYSSLNMLKDINVDVIKLDMKFIDLDEDNASKGLKIVESVVNMARKLRLLVIAEGAQTKQQVDQLLSVGCRYIQGYYFHEPLPVGRMEKLLAERPDDRHFWDMSNDFMHGSYVPVNGRTMLETSTLAASTFEILANGVAELSRLNVKTGEYRAVKRDGILPTPETDDFETYVQTLIAERVVHPDDADRFRADMDLASLRSLLFSQKSAFGVYRSEVLARTGIISFAVIPSRECSESDPWAVVMVGRNLSIESFVRLNGEEYRRDSLTGLLNRNAFDDDVEFIQATHDKPLTVMYIDLIGLHEINNHLGHARGDVVLCELADAARAYFGDDNIYRIGGDEFVIISFAHSMAQSARQMGYMRQELLDHGCELSVGMAESDDGEDIPDLVNQAENEMRKDKKRYYASGSGKRQLRTLNKQLEDILVRNKDMESLLQHLNTRYSIAYVVNLRADTQRPVVVPGYVQKMLDKHGGSFHEMLLDYCDKLVAPAYRDGFRMLFDYDYVRDRICREGAIRYAYVRNDGERFLITIFPDTHSVDEVMWVFAKEDTPSEE